MVISQAIGEKGILKFINSDWEQFKSLGMVQTVCHWRVVFFRHQIVLKALSQVWLGGVMVMASDLRSKGCRFDSQPFHCQVTTLGN